MAITFTVPGLPIAKGRPRLTTRGPHPRAYTPARTRKAEGDFLLLAKAHRPAEPLSGPLSLILRFVFAYPKSWPKKSRVPTRHTGRPDIDNLAKMVTDACNGVFWVDDSQIASLVTVKEYGPESATHVIIEVLEERVA